MSETNGERGPKGDHGEHGEQGERGSTGARGQVGARGQTGDAGRAGGQGAAGKAGPDPTRKLAIVYTLVTIALVTFGVFLQAEQRQSDENTARITSNTERIERARIVEKTENDLLKYESCLSDLEIVGQYNDMLEALIQVDEAIALELPNAPLMALQARIAAYEGGKILPAPCEAIKP